MSISTRVVYRSAVLAFTLVTVSAHQIVAATQSRIQTAIQDGDRTPVSQTISPRARRATDMGEAEGATRLSMSLYFKMTDAQQADLTQLLADQQNPASPQYHKWLTPVQFGARFGMSSSDMAKVRSWLDSKGLTVTEVPAGMNYIVFSGTVAQAESAFRTQIHSMTESGERHISNINDPQLPSAIANVISDVRGLNDFKPRSRAIVRPRITSPASGNHYIAPGDYFTIYDIGPLLSQSVNGTGVSIAVVGQTDISLTDVATFRSLSGLPTNAPTIVQATGYVAGTVSGDVTEAQLDVQWSGAVAPGATIKFVTVGSSSTADVTDALSYAVSNKVAPIISMSYGNCESVWAVQSKLNSINQTLQQANAQGITVVAASGDSGATDCDSTGLASEGLAVDFPASSPFVTAAGGTMFNDTASPSSYWNATNSSNGTNSYTSSAKSYIPESPWNETTAANALSDGGAGGGGSSAFFAKPSWQTGNGVPADASRDVPDISLASAAEHDGLLICSQSSCTNGFTNSQGIYNVVGGTSAAAPAFAGVLALLEQRLGSGPLGNVNAKLYGFLNSTYYNNAFHDVQSGNNSVYCIAGTPNCPNGGAIGYTANAGYDRATGLGSVDVASFVQYWPQVTPAAVATTTQYSTTTLTTSSATCGLTRSNYVFNVTVAAAPGSSGTPTGTVRLYVDNNPIGSAATLSSGSAQIPLDTTALTSGSHNVNAVYSGDATFAGSKGALLTNASNTGIITQIDVVSTTSADFSLTPCIATTTVASGATASAVQLTITPTAGFTGTVNLSANSDSGNVLGYSFSVKPVTITSGAATTNFVLTATVTSTTGKVRALPIGGSSGNTPWYIAGSGATLAGLMLVTVPRRRRWGTLLAVILSTAMIAAAGCGSGTSSSSNSGGTNTGPTPASKGTYNITITATSTTGRVHSVVLTYKVQ